MIKFTSDLFKFLVQPAFHLACLLILAMPSCSSAPKLLAHTDSVTSIESVKTSEYSFRFLIEAKIGTSLSKFVLDTGAYETRIADSEPFAMNLTGEKKMSGGVGAKPEVCDEVILPDLQALGIVRKLFKAERCQGTSHLGIDFFANSVFTLNFTDAKIAIFDPAKEYPAQKGATEFLPILRGNYGHINLPVEIDGAKITGVFDTGADFTLVDATFIKAHPDSFEEVILDGSPTTPLTDINGQEVQSHPYLAKDLQIGKTHFPYQMIWSIEIPRMMTETVGPIRMVIGSSTMIYADWIFDLKNNRWSATLRK